MHEQQQQHVRHTGRVDSCAAKAAVIPASWMRPSTPAQPYQQHPTANEGYGCVALSVSSLKRPIYIAHELYINFNFRHVHSFFPAHLLQPRRYLTSICDYSCGTVSASSIHLPFHLSLPICIYLDFPTRRLFLPYVPFSTQQLRTRGVCCEREHDGHQHVPTNIARHATTLHCEGESYSEREHEGQQHAPKMWRAMQPRPHPVPRRDNTPYIREEELCGAAWERYEKVLRVKKITEVKLSSIPGEDLFV